MPTKCYYEVLGVARDAADDDIKKAYRKQALVWHPDKNPDRIAEATEQFRAIQQAYDVLSDPQERTWYDDHREAIIRGGFKHRGADGSATEEDDSLDVYEYFTTSCFSGFGDDDGGFFAVYSKVFNQIFEEDIPFLDESERISAPKFGKSDSDYEEIVGLFYDFWESYTTEKSFCWKDKWDTREAPNRNYRRLMEAENKKLRDAGRKERNEEVRALVRFVKKRDPRVVVRRKEVEERNAAAAKKQAELRRQEAIARREMRAAVAKEVAEGKTDWAHTDDDQMRELEEKLASEFGHHSISEPAGAEEGAEEEDPLYCVACDKSFKTDKALVNHVRSKKHIERVEFVRSQLGEIGDNEDDEMATQILKRLEFLEAKANSDVGGDAEDDADGSNKASDSKKKGSNKKKKGKQHDSSDEDDAANGESSQPTATEATSQPASLPVDEPQKKPKVKTSKKKKGKQHDSSDEEDAANGESSQPATTEATAAEEPASLPVDEPQKKPKVKTRPVKVEPADDELEEVIYNCGKCKEVFPSRNKLFQHLQTTGHAQPPKSAAPPPSAKSGGKADKKGKSGKAK